jgi:hypothetical protein
MTQAIRADSDLRARWCAAVDKSNALSLPSQIELRRRVERLNILLFHLERDYQISISNQNEGTRFQRGFYLILFIGVVLLSLNATSVFKPYSPDWLLLAGAAILFFLLSGKEKCVEAAREAKNRIECGRHEFRELSGKALHYNDLKLLKSDSDDYEESPRLAEIIVESYEFLVERAWYLERKESLLLGVG